MKVFVSWSGSASKNIAKQVGEFLSLVIPKVECFQSSEGIEKGARWATEIATQLQYTSIGVLCLTSENVNAPWIAFEAGAVSKSIGEGRVVPLLFGISPSAIAGGPLAQFQALGFSKSELKKLVSDLCKKLSDDEKRRSDTYFEKFWPELEQNIDNLQKTPGVKAKPKEDPVLKMLDDIRGSQVFIQNRLRNPESFLPFWSMQKAVLLSQDPEQLSARLIQHIEYLEDLLDNINTEVMFVDTDDPVEMSDKLSDVESLSSNFIQLVDLDLEPK